ncbi:Alpha/Beta hydrolase protein [Lipomyces tetrasporus]
MTQSLDARAFEFKAPQKFSQDFTVPATDKHGPWKVTYAIGGPEHGEDVPTILFCCGMLATRWLVGMFDWIAEKEGVRMLFIDRPGIGGSTNVPLVERIPAFLEVVPLLLAHLKIKHISLASHSAGTIYALNLISRKPEILSSTNPSVTLFSPWVHQSHTSVSFLTLASMLPDSTLNQWDSILQFCIRRANPVFEASSSAFSPLTSIFASTNATAKKEKQEEEARRCLQGFGIPLEVKEANLKSTFRRIFAEETKGVNDEARLCLKSTKGTNWLACEDYKEYVRELGREWQGRITDAASKLKVDIVLPEKDIMVGEKGMRYFEDCWESEAFGQGIEVSCVRVKGADHETTIHPANETIARMFERAKGT